MRSPRSARIAILADVHANLPALSAVLADAQQRGCEQIYHAGDLIAIGPYPAEVVDLARASGMICVQGNHEAWVTTGLPPDPVPGLQDDGELMHQHWTHSRLDRARRDFIRGLPWAISETIQGVRLTVVHFALAVDGRSLKDVSPRWDDAGILDLFTDTPGDLVCFGHLHERRFNREYHGRHFLNPGAAGCSRRPEATYAIIEMADGHFAIEERQVTYEREALLARYDALEIPARAFIRKVFFGV
jgi:putative phosphoesterase